MRQRPGPTGQSRDRLAVGIALAMAGIVLFAWTTSTRLSNAASRFIGATTQPTRAASGADEERAADHRDEAAPVS
ncbi:MAG: hypothetical protein GY812_12445 [Actinomycetia bacterium]|nr:hypothetical protein [Actinomycetes bacterium]